LIYFSVVIGPVEFVIVGICYCAAGMKMFHTLALHKKDVGNSSINKDKLVKLALVLVGVAFGLMLSVMGTLMYLSFSAVIFFVGGIFSRLGILIVNLSLVLAFKKPKKVKSTSKSLSSSNSRKNQTEHVSAT